MTPAEAIYFAAAALPDAARAASLARGCACAAAVLPDADRAAYLALVCAGADELRRQVERMLAARPEVGDFLESPPAPSSGGETGTFAPDAPPADAAGPTADFPGRDEHVGS